MFTSSYKNFNTDLYSKCSISGDKGKMVGYDGNCYPKLAPKKEFWKKWHDNIGKISEEENNKYYIEEYYKEVLSKLDPMEVYDELEFTTLLCYEEPTEFCHRHIVAEWINLLLEIDVLEIKLTEKGAKFIRRPDYIREQLETVMKNNKNMHGFNSLRAVYLFDDSEKYEQKANELEEKGKCGDKYRQIACFLRCDADEAECEYNMRQRQKVMRKKRYEKSKECR